MFKHMKSWCNWLQKTEILIRKTLLAVIPMHDDFRYYLLCQQLSDFPSLDPEPQQLHLQSDAAFLPIHAGHSDGSRPTALQHVGHGEDSELCLWTQTPLKNGKHKSTQHFMLTYCIWFV